MEEEYTVEDTLEPRKCKFCGSRVEEYVGGDAYCQKCRKWQLGEESKNETIEE